MSDSMELLWLIGHALEIQRLLELLYSLAQQDRSWLNIGEDSEILSLLSLWHI